jgi:hypothetical protein
LSPDELTLLLQYLNQKYGYQATQLTPRNNLLRTCLQEERYRDPPLLPYQLYNQIIIALPPQLHPNPQKPLTPRPIHRTLQTAPAESPLGAPDFAAEGGTGGEQKLPQKLPQKPQQKRILHPSHPNRDSNTHTRKLEPHQIEYIWKEVHKNALLKANPKTYHLRDTRLVTRLAEELGTTRQTIHKILAYKTYQEISDAVRPTGNS